MAERFRDHGLGLSGSVVEHMAEESYVVRRTTDPNEAQSFVADTYLPNKLVLPSGTRHVDMELRALQVGALTAGRLGFGRLTSVGTAQSTNFRICIPLHGGAITRSGRNAAIETAPGEAAVIPPEAPAQVTWSPDCQQMVLMVSREIVESELETLLGRSLWTPLTFDLHMTKSGPVRGLWRGPLDMLLNEILAPSGLLSHTRAGVHAQALVLDGLLLGHHHNYSEIIDRRPGPARRTAIDRAVELLQSRPGNPWTVTGLAAEVHLSVRALHEGFVRDIGMPPIAYLRHVRLHRANAELQASDRSQTTVRAVANRLGILHMSRFAATYKATFGETPSATLARPTT
jgi:AraC-like DNA-binding protein